MLSNDVEFLELVKSDEEEVSLSVVVSSEVTFELLVSEVSLGVVLADDPWDVALSLVLILVVVVASSVELPSVVALWVLLSDVSIGVVAAVVSAKVGMFVVVCR